MWGPALDEAPSSDYHQSYYPDSVKTVRFADILQLLLNSHERKRLKPPTENISLDIFSFRELSVYKDFIK